eukprot:3937596-Rhodomonas_salina.1
MVDAKGSTSAIPCLGKDVPKEPELCKDALDCCAGHAYCTTSILACECHLRLGIQFSKCFCDSDLKGKTTHDGDGVQEGGMGVIQCRSGAEAWIAWQGKAWIVSRLVARGWVGELGDELLCSTDWTGLS